MKRTHRSKSLITKLVHVSELVKDKSKSLDRLKPQGLWYGVDGDWERWCESEEPHWITGSPYVYEIDLGSSNILIVDTSEKLLDFHDEFVLEFDPVLKYINWPAVMQLWDGIEIAPYQWGHRFDMLWYYAWDCTSGCIWEPSKLTIQLIEDSV